MNGLKNWLKSNCIEDTDFFQIVKNVMNLYYFKRRSNGLTILKLISSWLIYVNGGVVCIPNETSKCIGRDESRLVIRPNI